MSVPAERVHDNNTLVDLTTVSSTQEMAVRLAEMKQRLGLVQTFFKQVMVRDQDYGVIPGTEKPSLLKPGAEKLCELYGFAITAETEREEKDRTTGFYDCSVKVKLVSRRTGEVIAEGVGEANTYESRYRYRWVWPNQLPDGVDKEALVSRTTKSGKLQYRIENEDLFSLWNTVKKMAKKRALVDAALSATRSSGLFTQDIEDLREWAEAGEVIEAEFSTVANDSGETSQGGTGVQGNERLQQQKPQRQGRNHRTDASQDNVKARAVAALKSLAGTVRAIGVDPKDQAKVCDLMLSVGCEAQSPTQLDLDELEALNKALQAKYAKEIAARKNEGRLEYDSVPGDEEPLQTEFTI